MRIWGGLFLLGGLLLAGNRQDLDRDGVPDKLEQALLERFAPELVLSGEECDGLPAELTAGTRDPVVLARNGVLYGQAFRQRGRFIELHYFHLWGRDCGRVGHALDAEHVSALIEADRPDAPAKHWKARYWYAAGHEGTVCDRSHGARAASLLAVDRGPRVWFRRASMPLTLMRRGAHGAAARTGARSTDAVGGPAASSTLVNAERL